MENINYDFSNKDELKKYIMTNIQEYDLRINKLKEEIFELIFTNIPEDRKNGNAEVPIVRSENSDFQVLKTKKSKIYQEIRNIQKQLTISSIHSNEDVLKLNLKKQNLEQELLFINENPKKLTTIIITPASKTPSITAIVVDLKSISKILAASVPVHAPVPGIGIPTNNNKATKVLLPTFS